MSGTTIGLLLEPVKKYLIDGLQYSFSFKIRGQKEIVQVNRFLPVFQRWEESTYPFGHTDCK